jgi:hypothetical protein
LQPLPAHASPHSTMFKRALTEKAAQETDRIASSVESRGSGGGGKEEAPVFRNLSLMAGILLRPDKRRSPGPHVSPRVRCGDGSGRWGAVGAFMPSSSIGQREGSRTPTGLPRVSGQQ